ncbi:MAG: GNAT family N-acetyltransferase [Ilumatobacteraceae bacterium]
MTPATVRLRPAVPDDVGPLAALWHAGWLDGHTGHVPDALHEHRRPADFLARVPARLDATTVAVDGSAIVGFVTVVGDEVEQLYVASTSRGGGVATALLDHGESFVATHHEVAWLAVVAGNERARRFYARQGWRDDGLFDHRADIAGGTMTIPAHRYDKTVGGR